jgi:hypothetical protein
MALLAPRFFCVRGVSGFGDLRRARIIGIGHCVFYDIVMVEGYGRAAGFDCKVEKPIMIVTVRNYGQGLQVVCWMITDALCICQI